METVITKKFNRHFQMISTKHQEILNLKSDLFCMDDEDMVKVQALHNWLSGLFDGVFYQTYLEGFVKLLRELGYKGLSLRLDYIIAHVKKYKFES